MPSLAIKTFHPGLCADGIVTATASPAARNEDFNISASDERTVTELAQII